MSTNVIYKNRGEVFKCQLEVDGASGGDIQVRLCLEFNDNKNMFFYGQLDSENKAVITIPRLTEIEDKQGKLRIEAIVDDTYFKLYECPVELKNSVQMKISESSGTFFNNSSSSGAKIQFGSIEKETLDVEPFEEKKEDKRNPYIVNN